MGETLDLKLHTPQAKKVVFQGRNSTEMTVLWMRGEEEVNSGRLKEVEGFVVLKGLKIDDCGTYTVLDSHGLLVSTVHLTVEGNIPEPWWQQIALSGYTYEELG